MWAWSKSRACIRTTGIIKQAAVVPLLHLDDGGCAYEGARPRRRSLMCTTPKGAEVCQVLENGALWRLYQSPAGRLIDRDRDGVHEVGLQGAG